MLFGLRFDLRNPAFAGVSATDRARAALDMCEWADQRGALALTVSEHHGSDDGYLASPLVMAGAIAARTSNAMISVAALIAPFHDPLRLAEDTAVVDALSGGRLVLIIAGGYVPAEFEMFGVPLSERPKRVREVVTTLKQAWTGEPFEFRGRTVQITPATTNPGGPMIMLGGTSEAAARRAARIADGFVPSEPECWEHYRDECVKLGKPDPGAFGIKGPLGGQVVLAEDVERAWEELGPYFLYEAQAYGAWEASASDPGRPATFVSMSSVDEVRESGQYRILTPDEWAKELAEEEPGMPVFHPMVGGIPPELAWRHLRLFEEAFLR